MENPSAQTERQCPRCRLINPASARKCDCGWDFTSATAPALATPNPHVISSRARASWICPVAAWASQMVLATTLGHAQMGAAFWGLAALVQFVLIIAGLYLGLKTLALGRKAVPPSAWTSAIAGVILSAGTILLAIAMTVLHPR